MGQKISIPQQNQPFRRQATLGGDVSFRNLSESKENNSVVMATVTKVYYKQGRVDFKLANTATDTVSEAGNGIGSAPIPVDFYGYKADGKVFGHYRPIQIGDRVAVAYLWGHQESPIILGVYPNQASSYEFVAPPFATDSGDDKDENVKEYALADRKINPDGNVTYRTGKGSLYQTLNGHSFALIDDSPLYDQLWLDYEHIGAFRDADNKEINPLTETAGEWLLVHEDNQEGENADNHRTRFYVNKHGEFQIILSKSDSMDSALVVEGSKDKGFTAQQLFDIPEGDAFGGDMNHRQPELDKAPTYVKFNLGGSNQVASIEASSQAESQAQTTNLSVKPDGVYINGKAISDLIYNAGNKNDQKISDITNDIDDINQHLADKDKSDAQKDQDLQKKWADFDQKVQDNAKAASEAAKSAERAGDDAKAAGQAAVRAGDNAVSLTDDIKNKIIYYSSISKETDVHIPGKYLIINTDTYIANGTIKTAYIEDGAISSAKIGNEAVGTAQIARAAVGTLQVADGAIGTAQIKDLAVTDEKVGNLTFNHMMGQTLDANKINVKNISGDDISADTITANHLKIGKLSEISGDLGNIAKGIISAGDDPNKGVVINGLDADNPDKYTASKKAALFREVNALNASYQATLAYAQSVGIDATALQQAQQAMSDFLSPLFMNMGETTTRDHNKVVELEKALQQAISDIQNQFRYQLGTTANGKSTIYSGSQQPAHPKENDLWMKDTGSGTDIEIYNGAGWVSPSLNVVNNMNAALKNMPKTFFQSAQPDPKTTQLNEGDLWYKLTKDSNGNFVYTYYKWDNSVHMWVKLLNNGEVNNQSDINDLKNNIIKNLSDQVDSVNQGQQANQNSISDIKNNIIKNLADTVNQNEQTSQNNYNQLTGQIKTAQTNAINTANANTANQINGITSNGGGRNLWLNSKTFANTNVNVNTVDYSTDSDGITEAHITGVGAGFYGAWGNIYKNNVDPFNNGDTESFSVEMKGSGDITIGREGNFTKTFTVTNEWKRYSVTGTVTSSNAAHIMYNNSGKDVNIYVRLPMVEKGAITHDWSPAPEDQTAYTDTKVGQVQDNLNNLNTDYQAKVKLLNSINGKVDKITGSVVLLDTNYDGIMISPKTGIVNTTTGNTNTVNTVLSGDHGFLISKTPNKAGSATEDIFHVDTDGNLTIKGDFVGGNISGVNFTGASLNLAGSMKVSGSILAGDDGKGNAKVVINNDGLNMTSGDINLGDDKGTHVHIANDGTLTANQANISGNITATKLLLNDPTGNGQSSINLGGKFMVDSQGTVTANKFNSTNITVTGGEIKGTTIDGNTLKGNNINGGTITATNINASTINGGTITGATINGSNIVGGKFSSKDYGINGPSVVDYDNKYVGYSSSKQMPNFYVTPQGELLASKVVRRNELNTQGSYNPYMRLNSLVSISDNTASSGRYTYHKVGTFNCESLSSGIDIIYNLTSDADANYGFSTYNGTSKICFVILDGTTKVDDGSVINVVVENEVDETTKMISFTTSTGTKVNSYFYSSREWHYLYGALGDLQYSSVYEYLFANKSYEIGALVYQAAGDAGFFITPKDIGTKESTYPLTSFYSSEISPSGSVSLVHGDYNLDSVTIKDEEQLMQKSDIRRNLMTPDSIMLSTTTQANMMENTYDPNKYYTSISSEGIEFSEMHGNGKTSSPARLIFDGDNGSNGVYHDLFGNIWAQPTSWAYKWRDRNGDMFFQAPTDANSNFQFWIANAKNHGPIQIGWVHFGDSTYNWAGNVPAIYNTEGHLKGIALYDRYMIFFIDAFAYNATDRLMTSGDKPNVYEH